MGERIEHCQNQRNQDCNGCEVATEVARNVISRPKDPVVESILQVTEERCPIGTKFRHIGDLCNLIPSDEKIIQLRQANGEPSENREVSEAAAAGL